jgi:hypothetical protein
LNAAACSLRLCALARANRVFRTDKKRIRTEDPVIDKGNNSLGLPLYKIVDCARIRFSSARNRRSVRTNVSLAQQV